MSEDLYGTEAKVGDVVVSAASSTGKMKVGKIYRFDEYDVPWIKHAEWDSRKNLWIWRRTCVGSMYIVLRKPNGAWPTDPVRARLWMDYEADEPTGLE